MPGVPDIWRATGSCSGADITPQQRRAVTDLFSSRVAEQQSLVGANDDDGFLLLSPNESAPLHYTSNNGYRMITPTTHSLLSRHPARISLLRDDLRCHGDLRKQGLCVCVCVCVCVCARFHLEQHRTCGGACQGTSSVSTLTFPTFPPSQDINTVVKHSPSLFSHRAKLTNMSFISPSNAIPFHSHTKGLL